MTDSFGERYMGYWIAVVDDEPLSLTNAKTLLREQNMRVSCLRSGYDLLEFVKTHSPDLVLLDILMPDMDGFDTYRALRKYEEKAQKPQIPVIFLTGEDNSETERRGLREGASDFIHKPFDRVILTKRIKNTIVNSKTIESLTEEATLDKLTGFLNKASGTARVAELLKTTPGALIIMDLDNFKLVNDLFGHDMGDRVLVAFSQVVRFNVRADDVVSRIGGDEFMAFFPNLTQKDAVKALAERLNTQFSEEADSLMGEAHGVPLGISVGAVFTEGAEKDYQILFQYADSALYEVKRNGKHGYKIYDPMVNEENTETDLERELSHLIQIMSERGEGKGAMLLGQDAFSWNYRFIERFLDRYGGSAVRLLFYLDSGKKGVIFSEMVSEFGRILKNTLRRSDIIHQWQQNRFFVVLSMSEQKDIQAVVDRIMKAWEETGYADNISIKYTTSIINGKCPAGC